MHDLDVVQKEVEQDQVAAAEFNRALNNSTNR